jgi:uncharacterized membrane protein
MNKANDEIVVGKGRFESFSDGVFAIAITLLILEVRLPQGLGIATPVAQQIHALAIIWPQYLVYGATFANIGIMWLNHHAMLDKAQRITHRVVIANLVLLALICFLPFTTYVIEVFGVTAPAVVFYALVNVAIAFGYLFLQRSVFKAHDAHAILSPWNFVGLLAYPVAVVAGLFVPILAIVITVLVALFYAMPRSVELSRRPLEERF